MRNRVTEKKLIQEVVSLAKKIRLELDQSGLPITDLSGISQKYRIQLEWGSLPNDEDGCYLKNGRKIILNDKVTNSERINFSFCHEFMHDCIEHHDDLLSLFADVSKSDDDEMMERLCNAGAAELLMPSSDVRQLILEQGFSTVLIPEFCKRFQASSLAVAFQMVNHAQHECLLVIAEPDTDAIEGNTELVIIYTGRSSATKYSVKRWQILPADSLLYEVFWQGENGFNYGNDRIPFASGTEWIVPCNALFFRGKAFAFYNISQPVTADQPPLF